MYIAKKRIKEAISFNDGRAQFEDIADYTEYDCVDLAIKLGKMVENGELELIDGWYCIDAVTIDLFGGGHNAKTVFIDNIPITIIVDKYGNWLDIHSPVEAQF